jgi:TonB family protein
VPQPVYPEELAQAGVVGGAIIEVIVGVDGAISKATVLRSSHPEFANAAHAAVLQWRGTPAKKDGVPVESRWRIAVNFSVDGKEADWKWRVAPRPSLGSFTVGRAKLPAAEPAPAPAPAVPSETK